MKFKNLVSITVGVSPIESENLKVAFHKNGTTIKGNLKDLYEILKEEFEPDEAIDDVPDSPKVIIKVNEEGELPEWAESGRGKEYPILEDTSSGVRIEIGEHKLVLKDKYFTLL